MRLRPVRRASPGITGQHHHVALQRCWVSNLEHHAENRDDKRIEQFLGQVRLQQRRMSNAQVDWIRPQCHQGRWEALISGPINFQRGIFASSHHATSLDPSLPFSLTITLPHRPNFPPPPPPHHPYYYYYYTHTLECVFATGELAHSEVNQKELSILFQVVEQLPLRLRDNP